MPAACGNVRASGFFMRMCMSMNLYQRLTIGPY